MNASHRVAVTEVGLRDGLQPESRVLTTDEKVAVGLALIEAGVTRLEATAFFPPRAVPQLADASEVIAGLKDRGAELVALVPNVNGAWRAVAAGVERISFTISASETHSLKHANRTTHASLETLAQIGRIAADAGVRLSGAVAAAFGCPFEGDVDAAAVARIVEGFIANGAGEVTLVDSCGLAAPPRLAALVRELRARFPRTGFALHLHDTRGLGLVNVVQGLELGILRYESSIGGLGACAPTPGADGNIATEDLVNLLDELGFDSGLDLGRLVAAARSVESLVGHELPGRLIKAGAGRRRPAGAA